MEKKAMGIFEEAETVDVRARGARAIDPEYMEFTRSLLKLEDGQGRQVALPAESFKLVIREVERASRQLNMGVRCEYDKDAAGNAIVSNGKVKVRFAGWTRVARKGTDKPANGPVSVTPAATAKTAPRPTAVKSVPPKS